LNPAPLPAKHDWNIPLVELNRLDPGHAAIYDALIGANVLLTLNPIAAAILARGILTDRYDAPSGRSSVDNENLALDLSPVGLDPEVGFSEDDTQPYPLYGWLTVRWQSRLEAEQGGVFRR
jgi:hypothetical protein